MASRVQVGINLNSDPQAVQGRPANAADLNGVHWVRFVFIFHDALQNGVNPYGYDINQPLNYAEALRKAFAYYDPLIASYKNVLLVLNQQSFAGNAPWFPGSDGNWATFATNFAVFCGQIAAHYQGKNVAYEIWNEGDQKPTPGVPPASVFVPPALFAPILDQTVKEIRKQDANAPIVLGGLVSGTRKVIDYIQAIKDALGGRLPITEIGFHPYGSFPGQQHPNIPVAWFGRLNEEGLKLLTQRFPELKFWITEIGISEDQPIAQEFWPAIAEYMQGVYDLVQSKYSAVVPAVIWFAWSDMMRNAGIVQADGTRKQPIYNQFFKIAHTPESVLVPQPMIAFAAAAEPLFVTPTVEDLNVRELPSTNANIKTVVHVGDRLQVLEPDQQAALAKLGQQGAWIQLRTPDGLDGFSAAWLLTQITPLPASVPTDPVAGRQRALDFLHDPSFIDLPVMVSANAVSFFNGFGPNNFAYNQSLRADGGVYRNLFGLHDGLDFGVPHGTPLRAMDWGLVVHASRQANDSPFGARPFSVAVVYGKYLALYGHMSDSSIVKAGDIVAPGQKIGLSGTDPDDGPHLHFETRELTPTFLQELKVQIDANGLDTMSNWLDPNTVRARVRAFTNPARFFTVRLETHHWPSGQHLPNLDHDNNGYPDQVVRAGDTQPTAFDLYWLPSYPPRRGSFWEGSHIA